MSNYYYFILLAIFLTTVGLFMLYGNISTRPELQENMSTIPFFMLLVAQLIFFVIAFLRFYPLHLLLYFISIALLAAIILSVKRATTPSHMH